MIRMFWYFKVVIIYFEISSLIFNSNIFLKRRNWFIGKSKSGFLSNSILSIWKEFKILYFEMKTIWNFDKLLKMKIKTHLKLHYCDTNLNAQQLYY